MRRSGANRNTSIRSGNSRTGIRRGGVVQRGASAIVRFLNLGGESFADASAVLGFDLEQDSRGIGLCDWDHDGDVDIWMTNRTAPRLQFLRNENAAAGERFRRVSARRRPAARLSARCSWSAPRPQFRWQRPCENRASRRWLPEPVEPLVALWGWGADAGIDRVGRPLASW